MANSYLTRRTLTCLILTSVLDATYAGAVKNSSDKKPVEKLLFSGVNDVQFIGQEEQTFLGSGFALEHQGRFYGDTAKHVLLMKKSGSPTNTDIQSQLKHWRLRDPRNKLGSKSLILGRLLNGDAKEAVTPNVLESDYLAFELPNAVRKVAFKNDDIRLVIQQKFIETSAIKCNGVLFNLQGT